MYPKLNVIPSTSSANPVDNYFYKDVVVIGNGPSAICLSYILSGNWPYYSPDAQHPIQFLHHRLANNRSISILLQDLRSLCDGLEGRSDNPVSVLFDTLNHPDADLGVDLPSCLSWIHHQEHRVDHVVIGRGLPGGSWQDMEQSALTLSLEPWMDMPDYKYKDWEKERLRERTQCSSLKRATVGHVARYYRDFVVRQNLESNFKNHSIVTSVRKFHCEHEKCEEYMNPDNHLNATNLWEVSGHSTWDQTPFRYITPNVVLANGSYDEPNRLHVPGEELPFVTHYSSKLEKLIIEERLGPHSDPILIVGAGLTAADAIITARFFGVPIAHTFRRDVNDPALIFNRLPENMYPDYHKIHQMMKQRENLRSYRGYQSYSKHRVVEILPDHKVRIEGTESSIVLKVSFVLILIGSKPNFSFMEEEIVASLKGDRISGSGREVLRVDAYTHQSFYEKGLFAVGPLVGDNFIRFLQGGALAVASYLAKMRSLPAVEECEKTQVMMSNQSDFGGSLSSAEDEVETCFRWSRVLSCPEGIEVDVDGATSQLLYVSESEMEQTIEMLQRRCRFRSGSKRRQQARRRRASHSSCDKLTSTHSTLT